MSHRRGSTIQLFSRDSRTCYGELITNRPYHIYALLECHRRSIRRIALRHGREGLDWRIITLRRGKGYAVRTCEDVEVLTSEQNCSLMLVAVLGTRSSLRRSSGCWK